MKLLVTTSSLVGAGISSYVKELISFLCKQSYEVCVASPDLDKVKLGVPGCIKEALHIPIGKNAREDRETCRHLFKFICLLQPDLIINNDNHFMSTIWPAVPQNIYRISVVHFPGGVIAKDAVLNWQYVDRIITISSAMKEIISRRCDIPSSRIKVVYNGINPPYVESESNLMSRFSKNLPLHIGFFGGQLTVKGAGIIPSVLHFLDRQNRKVKFIWVGLDRDIRLNLSNKNIQLSGLKRLKRSEILNLLQQE